MYTVRMEQQKICRHLLQLPEKFGVTCDYTTYTQVLRFWKYVELSNFTKFKLIAANFHVFVMFFEENRCQESSTAFEFPTTYLLYLHVFF